MAIVCSCYVPNRVMINCLPEIFSRHKKFFYRSKLRPGLRTVCEIKIGARRPVSRVLYPQAGDGHSSGTFVTERLARPTRTATAKTRSAPPRKPRWRMPSLLGLAPGGVCRAAAVTGGAVRSYRTLSPLPPGADARSGGLLSVALSLGSPPPGVTRHRVSVEPGLSSPRKRGAAIRPSGVPVS